MRGCWVRSLVWLNDTALLIIIIMALLTITFTGPLLCSDIIIYLSIKNIKHSSQWDNYLGTVLTISTVSSGPTGTISIQLGCCLASHSLTLLNQSLLQWIWICASALSRSVSRKQLELLCTLLWHIKSYLISLWWAVITLFPCVRIIWSKKLKINQYILLELESPASVSHVFVYLFSVEVKAHNRHPSHHNSLWKKKHTNSFVDVPKKVFPSSNWCRRRQSC